MKIQSIGKEREPRKSKLAQVTMAAHRYKWGNDCIKKSPHNYGSLLGVFYIHGSTMISMAVLISVTQLWQSQVENEH